MIYLKIFHQVVKNNNYIFSIYQIEFEKLLKFNYSLFEFYVMLYIFYKVNIHNILNIDVNICIKL